MVGYFDALSDLDFEELVADVMRAEEGLPYRAGTRGPDASIDVVAEDKRGMHVVACKHYRDSTFAQLKAAAKKEATSLTSRGARFASYRFVTSRRLAHTERQQLAHEFAAFIAEVEAVWGEGDLRAALRRHPEVEQGHPKLWLASTGALRHALSARAYGRSAALLADVRQQAQRYVQTSAYQKARQLLERESVCVITGPPGIGKTTLARLLLLDALESGHQPYEIVQGSLGDAWELLELPERQIFLFDDFLGQTFLEDRRDPDADLLRFIRTVARKADARLVLATREYILQEANQLSEILARESDPAQRFLLRLPDLTREDRARIFYNHIWCSPQLTDTARRSLLQGHGYLRVIDHPAYNPRVIEWVCGLGSHRLSAQEQRNFPAFCVHALEHPRQLWDHAYRHGISDAERALLLAMPGLGARVGAPDLERAFEASCAARGVDATQGRFMRSVAVLDESFLTSTRVEGDSTFSFANPSLLDFLQAQISQSLPDSRIALASAAYFEQVIWLYGALSRSGLPPDELAEDFSKAFSRTFNAVALDAGRPTSFAETASREALESAADRLDAVLRRSARWRPLQETCISWLSEAGRRWLKDSTSWNLAFFDVSATIEQLVDIGALDGQTAADLLVAAVDRTERGPGPLHHFELISFAHSLAPDGLGARLDEERAAFAVFAQDALEELGRHLDDHADLGMLENVAAALGVELPQMLVEEYSAWLTEVEEQEDAERQRDYRERDDHYDADDGPVWTAPAPAFDVDAMFGRLAD